MAKSEFIPNTYQKPNLYVDQYMAFLTANEWKVLDYAIRRIFGFNKREDRISISQFCDGTKDKDGNHYDYGTGLSRGTVISILNALVEFGFLIIVSPHDKKQNMAPKYSLQIDSEKIDIEAIMERYETQKGADKKRAAIARKGIKSADQTDLVYGLDQGIPSITVRPDLVYGLDQTSSNGQTYNIPKKHKETKNDSTAKAVSTQDENSDPLAGYFGSNGIQPKEQAAQAEKPKKLNKLAAARLRLHTAFAEARGCSLPEWKTDKQKKANSTNWNKAVDRLMQECDGDLDLAERIIREDVKSYLMGEKDPRYPMVEPRSFESRWVARAIDARMKSALSTPQYFRASDVPQGKTILEFQQEIAGD